jgi:hypothetical protein
MRMTIDIPEIVLERAAALGTSVSSLVSEALINLSQQARPAGFVRLGTSSMTREQATAALLDIQRSHTLGGISIKSLIEEGRRL